MIANLYETGYAIQPPITIPGNPITTATKASDIAVVSLKGATTVTKPDPDADISPTNIATITGIANPTITASSGAASNSQTISGELYSLPNGTADEYDGQAGRLTKRVGKIVLDGTENWGVYDTSQTPYLYTYDFSPFVVAGKDATASMCTHYLWSLIGVNNTDTGYRITSVHIVFRPGNVDTTVEAWTAYLSAQAEANTPVTIYYELDNPETTEAAYDLTCYDGNTTFSAPSVPAANLSVTLLDGRTVGRARDAELLAGLPPSVCLFPENLLINPDFRQPVNQRGQTVYTATGGSIPCIDRWNINTGLNCEVKKGYITLTASGQFQYFYQNVKDISGQFKFSVRFRSLNRVNLGAYDLGRTKALSYVAAEGTGDWQTLEVSVNVPEGLDGISLLFHPGFTTAGGSADILMAELAAGGRSLLDYRLQRPPADYGTELAKCQRYLLVLDNTIPSLVGTIPIAVETNVVHVYIPLPVTMYRVPTSPENLISDFCIHQPNNTNIEITNIRGIYASANMVNISIDVPGVVAGVPCRLESKSGTSNPILLLSAEL